MSLLARPRRTAGRPFAWGIADQACASLASFVLTLTTARALGPAGLGAIFVGFASYLAVLSFQRGLITEPLITSSAAAPPEDSTRQTRSAFSLVLATGAIASAGLAACGLAVGGSFGAGMLAFAPWLVPALTQDVVRFVLFRDGRPRRATFLDVTWLALTAAWIPATFVIDSPLGVTSGWGIGCAVASCCGLASLRIRPGGLQCALRWWRTKARALGSWLVAESLLTSVATYAVVVILGAVLGAAALGGLRAAQSALMPLTVLAPAVTLVGLPAMARMVRTSSRDAHRFAVRVGIGTTAVTVTYVFVFVLEPEALAFAFGDEFASFADLVWPLGVGQCAGALVSGAVLVLKASSAGSRLFIARGANAALALALAPWLGTTFGVDGAAWGMTAAAAASSALIVLLALPLVGPRRIFRAERPPIAGPAPDESTRREGKPNVNERAVVDAVVVAYDSGGVIRACVESLLDDPAVGRVVVVNNSPGDASADVASLPAVVYRESESNLGYGRAVNSARDAVSGPYVALVNPDATQQPGTISTLRRFLDEHVPCALVAPRMVTSDGGVYRNSKHDMSLPRLAFEALGWPESLGVTRTRAEHERSHRTSYVIASFVLCRRAALDEVGWFDESIFLFGEDQDLCRRLRSHGWEIWYAPVGEVRHLSGHSWRQLSDRGKRLFREARYRELRNASGPLDAELYRALVWARDTTHRLAGDRR